MAIFGWHDFERDAAGGNFTRLPERYATAEDARGREEWLVFLVALILS